MRQAIFTTFSRRGDTIVTQVAVVAIFTVAFLGLLLVRPGGAGSVALIDNLASIAGPLLMLVLFFVYAARRSSDGNGRVPTLRRAFTREKRAIVLLCLSVLMDTTAQGIWTYYAQVLHTPTPFPSLADVAYLSYYPLLLAAILSLPRGSLPGASRPRVLLDGLLIMAGAVTFSWYFVLGPTVLAGHESTLAKVVGTAYPVGDLLLLSCLIGLAVRIRDRATTPIVSVIAAAIALLIIADSLFDYGTLHGTYQTGDLVDVAWPVSDMLLCMAASMVLAMTRVADRPRDAVASTPIADVAEEKPGALWLSCLPYVLLPAVGALALYTATTPDDARLEHGVYLGGVVIVALVVIRQILSIVENRQLYHQLHSAHLDVVAHAHAAEELHGELRVAHHDLTSKHAELSAANARLQSLAITDALTGLPNHRALVGSLDQELERAARYNRNFTAMFLDIDHFKALNDTHGHAAGDAALKAFGTIARAALRGVDIVGRWGGEEFLAILPEIDATQAIIVAERVRRDVANHVFELGGGTHMTCSIGLAAYPRDAQDRDTLVMQADRAMYLAKHLGRNQVRQVEEVDDATAATSDRGDIRGDAALMGTVEALVRMVEARDDTTGRHGEETAHLALQIAFAYGLDASTARLIGIAARLHDIGKVAVPDRILRKPGKLTAQEWLLIETHPLVGADVLTRVPGLRPLAPLVRSHHERWDGAGYPDKRQGEEIPVGARIIAVADAYRAMTMDRPYQAARTEEEAMEVIVRCTGTQFDPTVVEALERVILERPPLRALVS